MNKRNYMLFGMLLLLLAALFWKQPVQTNQTPTVSSTPAATPQQVVLGQATKSTGCTTDGSLPDRACTPGAVDPRVTQDNIASTICVSGYTKTVRPSVTVTNKIKTERMGAYGDTDSPANYELDHLISLELGGCPDCVANLWPEPYTTQFNAHEKDKVENYLHQQVCNGTIRLQKAQEEIAGDWRSVYNELPTK